MKKQKRKRKDNQGVKLLFNIVKFVIVFPFLVFQLECRLIGQALLTLGGSK